MDMIIGHSPYDRTDWQVCVKTSDNRYFVLKVNNEQEAEEAARELKNLPDDVV